SAGAGSKAPRRGALQDASREATTGRIGCAAAGGGNDSALAGVDDHQGILIDGGDVLDDLEIGLGEPRKVLITGVASCKADLDVAVDLADAAVMRFKGSELRGLSQVLAKCLEQPSETGV